MKAALLFILTLAFLCSASGAERQSRAQMKGMELYSWNDRGSWVFVVLAGTNRMKSEQEVKGSTDRIESIDALAGRFTELAQGEQVVWNSRFVPGFAFPNGKMFAEIVAAAKHAKIVLIPDKP